MSIEALKIGYLAEGARLNYLPSQTIFEQHFTKETVFISLQDARFGPSAWEIQVPPRGVAEYEMIVELSNELRAVTFSCFAGILDGDQCTLVLAIETDLERRVHICQLSTLSKRRELSVLLARPTSILRATIRIESISDRFQQIGLGTPVLEAGLFASTPLGLGASRDSDGLSYQRHMNVFEGASGTITLYFSPQWSGHQLAFGDSPHLLSCRSADGKNCVDIFSDAQDQ